MADHNYLASLTPCNEKAERAFHSLYGADQSYAMSFIAFDGQTTQRYGMQLRTGCYILSLDNWLRQPSFGWRFGCEQADLLLADPKTLSTSSHNVKSIHASFIFNSNGVLTLYVAHDEPPTIVWKNAGQRIELRANKGFLLLAPETIIDIDGFQYRFTYIVDHEHERRFQNARLRYFYTILKQEPPVAALSATPTPRDEWIGRWKIGSEVGRGSQQVFRSALHRNGLTAVVKRLHRNDIRTAAMVGAELLRFQDMQMILLRHDSQSARHLLSLCDCWTSSGQLDYRRVYPQHDSVYLFFTPQGRGDFNYLATQGPKPLLILRMLYQILLGIRLLHRCGFVHRDIKPANMCYVSLDPAYAIVIDMMTVRKCPDHGFEARPCTVGTLGFLAPEKEAAESTYGYAVDMFAIGCSAYLLFVGHDLLPRDFNPWAAEDKNLTEPERIVAKSESEAAIVEFTRKREQLLSHTSPDRADAYALLYRLLDVDPQTRITADQACEDIAFDEARQHWHEEHGKKPGRVSRVGLGPDVSLR